MRKNLYFYFIVGGASPGENCGAEIKLNEPDPDNTGGGITISQLSQNQQNFS